MEKAEGICPKCRKPWEPEAARHHLSPVADAVEFAEWMFENGWCWAKDIPECYGWYNDFDLKTPPKSFTTEQLYKLFLSRSDH